MTLSYSAPLCALVGALSCLPIALLRKTTRGDIRWMSVIEALEGGARDALAVAMACACAGIVIGVISLTGLGITFTQMVVALSQNSLVLALMLTAVAGIVLGMGMPTTPAYIVMVSLLVPALIKLGVVDACGAHVPLYFAVLSAITPPVALAVFAAAALAKANLWRAGWEAVRIGAAGFIVPFMFVYEPALLMIGDWQTILLSTTTATIGCVTLAAGLFGYLARPCLAWERVVLVVAALCLIKPGGSPMPSESACSALSWQISCCSARDGRAWRNSRGGSLRLPAASPSAAAGRPFEISADPCGASCDSLIFPGGWRGSVPVRRSPHDTCCTCAETRLRSPQEYLSPETPP